MTNIGWMVDFDTEETDDKAVWNEAANSLNDSDSQVMEQVNRILTVHPAEKLCHLCPAPVRTFDVPPEAPDEDPKEEPPAE